MRRETTQQEWLVEDLAQIRRYFPGAELLETLNTPFDITSSTQSVHERTARARGRLKVRPSGGGTSNMSEVHMLRSGGVKPLLKLENGPQITIVHRTWDHPTNLELTSCPRP